FRNTATHAAVQEHKHEPQPGQYHHWLDGRHCRWLAEMYAYSIADHPKHSRYNTTGIAKPDRQVPFLRPQQRQLDHGTERFGVVPEGASGGPTRAGYQQRDHQDCRTARSEIPYT